MCLIIFFLIIYKTLLTLALLLNTNEENLMKYEQDYL